MRKIITILFGVALYIQVVAQWQPNGASIYYNGGNVGIGTASPQTLLHVAGTSFIGTPGNEFYFSSGTTFFNTKAGVRNNGGDVVFNSQASGTVYLNRDVTADTRIQSNLTDIAVFLRNGYVGIGTSTPSSTLEVSGQSTFGNRLNGTTSDLEAMSVYNTTSSNLSSGNGAVIQFYNNSNNFNGNSTPLYGASVKSVSSNNQYGWESDLYLRTTKNNAYNSQVILNAMIIKGGSGYVGIGTTSPDAPLTVSGQVHAQEVKVTVNAPGPDYVFEKDYALPSLDQIKTYIEENKHLPEVPSAKEMEKKGVQLGEMNLLLLKKIEELTLYVIEQNKKIEELNQRDLAQQKEINSLKSRYK